MPRPLCGWRSKILTQRRKDAKEKQERRSDDADTVDDEFSFRVFRFRVFRRFRGLPNDALNPGSAASGTTDSKCSAFAKDSRVFESLIWRHAPGGSRRPARLFRESRVFEAARRR